MHRRGGYVTLYETDLAKLESAAAAIKITQSRHFKSDGNVVSC